MEMDDKLSFDLAEVKADLIIGMFECNKRGLIHSGDFLSLFCLFIEI